MEYTITKAISEYFEQFRGLWHCLNIDVVNNRYEYNVRGTKMPFYIVSSLKEFINNKIFYSKNNHSLGRAESHIYEKYKETKDYLARGWHDLNDIHKGNLIKDFDSNVYCQLEGYLTSLLIKQPTVMDFYNAIMDKLDADYYAIMALFPDTSTNTNRPQSDKATHRSKEPPQIKAAQSKPTPNFTRVFSEIEQKKLFDGLINGSFLPKETIYNHFCYVFGGTAIPENEKSFNPLVWQKSVGFRK